MGALAARVLVLADRVADQAPVVARAQVLEVDRALAEAPVRAPEVDPALEVARDQVAVRVLAVAVVLVPVVDQALVPAAVQALVVAPVPAAGQALVQEVDRAPGAALRPGR